MANYVKISTIGARPLVGAPETFQDALDGMIDYWHTQLNQVLPDQPDLIVVPEACDRYSDYPKEKNIDFYRFRGNKVRDFFSETADKHNCYIAYSASREIDDGSWRNSTQIIDRKGNVAGIYNKNHVVIEETTEGGALCGKDAPIIECDFGRVACAICFDLNFDELRFKYVEAKPDLIIFCSMYHGGLMQNYWAYSCRSHFVGAIAGLKSSIIAPDGELIASTTNYTNHITASVNLDCKLIHLDYNGKRFKDLKEKYGPKVKITDPGYLGSVLISSETDECNVMDMIREFDIEILDDYFERALAHHHNPDNIEK